MRRTPVMIVSALALVPVLLFTTAASAATSTGTLTVTTYDRAGGKVSATLRAIDVASGTPYSLSSGKAKKLKSGTYAVIARIHTGKDGSDTLGARVLKVSGKVSTSIDARSGRALTVGLDKTPAGDFVQSTEARICGTGSDYGSVGASGTAGKLFVIPNSSKHVQLAYTSNWANPSTRTAYVVSATTSSAVPSSLAFRYKTASLAGITATVRAGVQAGPYVMVAMQKPGTGCDSAFGAWPVDDAAPYVAKLYASPGKWDLRTDTIGGSYDIGGYWLPMTLAAGKKYAPTFYRSAWGPAQNLPYVYGNSARFSATQMFVDPGFGWNQSATSSEGGTKSLVTFSTAGGKVLKKQWRSSWGDGNPDFTATVPANGWYHLTVTSVRQTFVPIPSGTLSTKSQVVFSFKAVRGTHREADVIMPRMLPWGLNSLNRAATGSSTVVQISGDRQNYSGGDVTFGKVTAKTVTMQASFDGGKTWHPVKVTKSGSQWNATVNNPGKSAFVDLRSRITATNGQWSEVTLSRAYRVG